MPPIDIERESTGFVEAHGFDPAQPPSPETLAMCELGAERIVTRQALRTPAMYIPELDAIEVRAGLSALARQMFIAHELAERMLLRQCWSGEVVEAYADALGCAIMAPRPAVRAALRIVGRNLPALAQALGVSQSIASIRLGEVTGSAMALVTPRRVIVRGESFEWPREPEIRRAAGAKQVPVGLERVLITDAPRRVVLVAA
jgi:hypothetical protein